MRLVNTLLRFESYDIAPGHYSDTVLRIKIMRLVSCLHTVLRIKIMRLVGTLLRFESCDNLLRLATTLIQF